MTFSERRETPMISFFRGGRLVEELIFSLDPESPADVEWFLSRINMDKHDLLISRGSIGHDEVRASWCANQLHISEHF